MSKTKGKLSLAALSLMIFTTVYGFSNIPRAFYMMGLGAIPWYIVGGLLFFLPFAFMVTEMGSSFKEEKGGIYSWMERSVNPTFAFIGTFMWYASYVIWMVSVSNGVLVPITNVIFGTTKLPSTVYISVFAIIFVGAITLMALRGIDSIKKVTTIGGIMVLSLNVILIVGALLVLILNGHPAETISMHQFVSSPAPGFDGSAVSFIAFMVFAIFAYGGVESVAGLVDETDKPEKNFPRGIIISALIIAVGYSVAIFTMGFFVNYHHDWFAGVSNGSINLGNVAYVAFAALGTAIGQALHLSHGATVFLGQLFARYVGLSMLLALGGAFFTLIYSPIKQIIQGTPKELWPGRLSEIKDGMPKQAMKMQYFIVAVIILLNMILSIVNQGAAAKFFEVLTNMSNVSMTLPYLAIVIAYVKFKHDDSIDKPFEIFHSKKLVMFLSILVLIVVGAANLFTIIQPLVEHTPTAWTDFASMVAGPVIFGLIAYWMMARYNKKYKK